MKNVNSCRLKCSIWVVEHGQMSPPTAEVEAINSFEAPRCRHGLQLFPGILEYYRRFIPGYSTMLAPFGESVKERWRWERSSEYEWVFSTLKEMLCSCSVLQAPDFTESFSLAKDTNRVTAGVVLLQTGEDQVDHPLSYFSKKFSAVQKINTLHQRGNFASTTLSCIFTSFLPSDQGLLWPSFLTVH